VAIVTGGGSGIGAAIAQGLAAGGAHCVLAGRRPHPLAFVAEQIMAQGGGATASAAPTDVTDPAQVDRLVKSALAVTGRVDLLVNCAGRFTLAPFEETSLELFDAMLAVNLRGAFLCCRAVWEPMRRSGGGQILNVSSLAGLRAFAGNTAYSPSKFGLNGLSVVLALEGRPHNIRVTSVCPAATNTAIWDGLAPQAVRDRMMPAQAVAEVACSLLAAPRTLAFEPVVVVNFNDPWSGV
jgi:NAD(P)-dependent dehydrogenase (short-subunit alcohol dehydrogenase family)